MEGMSARALKDLLDGVHQPEDDYAAALLASMPPGDVATYAELGSFELPAGNGYVHGGIGLGGRRSYVEHELAVLEFADPSILSFTGTVAGVAVFNRSRGDRVLWVTACRDARGRLAPLTVYGERLTLSGLFFELTSWTRDRADGAPATH